MRFDPSVQDHLSAHEDFGVRAVQEGSPAEVGFGVAGVAEDVEVNVRMGCGAVPAVEEADGVAARHAPFKLAQQGGSQVRAKRLREGFKYNGSGAWPVSLITDPGMKLLQQSHCQRKCARRGTGQECGGSSRTW
jgi:hypothetical protein